MSASNYAPGVTDRDLPGSEEIHHTCMLASADRACEACARGIPVPPVRVRPEPLQPIILYPGAVLAIQARAFAEQATKMRSLGRTWTAEDILNVALQFGMEELAGRYSPRAEQDVPEAPECRDCGGDHLTKNCGI